MLKETFVKKKKLPDGITYDYGMFNKNKGVEILHYDSVAHMVESAKDNATKRKYLDKGDFDEWTWGTEFQGLESTTEALRNGECSQKTLKHIEEYRNVLLNMDGIDDMMRRADTFKRRRKFGESGSELDIDRVLSGDPEHWQSMTRGKKQNVIRLGVNFSVTCGHSEEQLNKLGALTTVAVDMLQRCGLAVEVVGLCVAHKVMSNNLIGSKPEQGFTCVLKSAQEKLDVSRIACIGIPGLYRAYGFTTWINYLEGRATSGLGYGNETSNEVKDLLNIKHLLEVKWTKEGREKAFLTELLKSISEKEILETV